jgi:hypothetical protein
MAGSTQSDSQGCACFPFPVSGKYDDQTFFQDALPFQLIATPTVLTLNPVERLCFHFTQEGYSPF